MRRLRRSVTQAVSPTPIAIDELNVKSSVTVIIRRPQVVHVRPPLFKRNSLPS
jgi:hypothetical protein